MAHGTEIFCERKVQGFDFDTYNIFVLQMQRRSSVLLESKRAAQAYERACNGQTTQLLQ